MLDPHSERTVVEATSPLAQPRPLPVLILADASASMKGDKIEILNTALAEMQKSFRDLRDPRAQPQLALIAFADKAREVVSLTAANQLQLPTLTAAGTTALGAALDLAAGLLERVPRRAWLPTLVVASDGKPTDDWQGPLQRLLASPRGGRAIRLAVGIGPDCNFSVLRQFIKDPDVPVVRPRDVSRLAAFFRFVSYSVRSRSVARDPDVSPLPWHLLEDDELLLGPGDNDAPSPSAENR